MAGLATLASTPASATTYLFTLSGSTQASFTLPNAPTPNDFDPGISFRIDNVVGTVDGTPDDQISLTFYNGTNEFGGLEIASFNFYSFIGEEQQAPLSPFQQLYTGTEAAPTFLPGTYQLLDFTDVPNSNRYTLTIAAVPEPATWGMMIMGFGVIGVTLRYRRSAASSPVKA